MSRLGFAVVVAVALVGVACSSGGSGELSAGEGSKVEAGQDVTQVAEASGVTVAATWLTGSNIGGVDADLSLYSLDGFVLFEISFTTHTGNLNEIDMERAATLRHGEEEMPPEAWVSVSDDSHHRAGVLVFPQRQDDGPVELTIDIGDDELALLWEAAPTT